MHFQRNYIFNISLKIYQKIIIYIEELIIWFIQNISISSNKIEVIERIKVIQDFKYIIGFKCHKLEDISDSMKKYYKIIHDWNNSKDDMNIIIYWYINNLMRFIIHINNLHSIQCQIFHN